MPSSPESELNSHESDIQERPRSQEFFLAEKEPLLINYEGEYASRIVLSLPEKVDDTTTLYVTHAIRSLAEKAVLESRQFGSEADKEAMAAAKALVQTRECDRAFAAYQQEKEQHGVGLSYTLGTPQEVAESRYEQPRFKNIRDSVWKAGNSFEQSLTTRNVIANLRNIDDIIRAATPGDELICEQVRMAVLKSLAESTFGSQEKPALSGEVFKFEPEPSDLDRQLGFEGASDNLAAKLVEFTARSAELADPAVSRSQKKQLSARLEELNGEIALATADVITAYNASAVDVNKPPEARLDTSCFIQRLMGKTNTEAFYPQGKIEFNLLREAKTGGQPEEEREEGEVIPFQVPFRFASSPNEISRRAWVSNHGTWVVPNGEIDTVSREIFLRSAVNGVPAMDSDGNYRTIIAAVDKEAEEWDKSHGEDLEKMITMLYMIAENYNRFVEERIKAGDVTFQNQEHISQEDCLRLASAVVATEIFENVFEDHGERFSAKFGLPLNAIPVAESSTWMAFDPEKSPAPTFSLATGNLIKHMREALAQLNNVSADELAHGDFAAIEGKPGSLDLATKLSIDVTVAIRAGQQLQNENRPWFPRLKHPKEERYFENFIPGSLAENDTNAIPVPLKEKSEKRK